MALDLPDTQGPDLREAAGRRTAAPALRAVRVLENEGWVVRVVHAPGTGAAGFALLARRAAAVPGRGRTVVVHGFDHGFDVRDAAPPEARLHDVWRLVAHLNESCADGAAVLLGGATTISPMALDTCRRLGVQVRRLDTCDPAGARPEV